MYSNDEAKGYILNNLVESWTYVVISVERLLGQITKDGVTIEDAEKILHTFIRVSSQPGRMYEDMIEKYLYDATGADWENRQYVKNIDRNSLMFVVASD